MTNKRIGDVLERDLSQRIEEVISLTQQDEQAVYTELTEYIVTDHILDNYRNLLDAIARAPSSPHEGIGVWVSGFFGSGKSSFVKNLGYILANQTVLDRSASELFIEQVHASAPDEQRIPNLIRNINNRLPTEVIMFDVSVDRAVQRETERIAEVMYRVLLRELDYAEDFDIAELEIELESEGRLAEFITIIGEQVLESGRGIGRLSPAEESPVTLEDVDPLHYAAWQRIRKGAQRFVRASTALHTLDPNTYTTADTWANSMSGHATDVTVKRMVERTFDLVARRRPGQAAMYIIDEVGQYVARSADKILDLQAVVREFGPVGKNKVVSGQAVAPVWVIVTAQEKLDEVVAAIDSKRVELAKLQDSFRFRIDLGQADIQEVASRRVLAKKQSALPTLKELYQDYRGQLNARCALERSGRFSPITEEDFIEHYPYLPHHISLSIDIMSGVRLQPGGPRHLGGSNRTIIKQAYEMLVNPRTHLEDAPLGTLVTLDRVFELVVVNLSHEKQRDVDEITRRYGDDAWETRIAKALALLEFVRDLPRTEANIAALLYERLGQPSIQTEVETALERLEAGEFIRQTEDGWKLLSASEKQWQTERNSLEPRPTDEMELIRETVNRLWDDPGLRNVTYKNLRPFSFTVTVEGRTVRTRGDIPLQISPADDTSSMQDQVERSRVDTRAHDHRQEIHWHFARTPELDRTIVDLYRSNQMVGKYGQLSAQGVMSAEEAANLENEKRAQTRLRGELSRLLEETLATGTGVFQGNTKSGSELGRTWKEIVRSLIDWVVPKLYDKLKMGIVTISGKEPEQVLKAANLNALPPVLYDSDDGLGLITSQNGRYVPNTDADVSREVMSFIQRQHNYGNRVTGKHLEEEFSSPPYGWDVDLLRLVLAVLLRAGQVEVTHQGRRYRTHTDPQARVPFGNLTAFRAATYSPRVTVDLRTLARAAESLEDLTGEEVDVEETAIADTAQRFAREELETVRPLLERAKAHRLPFVDSLSAYQEALNGILTGLSDDVVRTLAEEGKSLKEQREQYYRVRNALQDRSLRVIERARRALREMWPALESRPEGRDIQERVEPLGSLLNASELAERLTDVENIAQTISEQYRNVYEDLHIRRGDAYQQALERLQASPEWEQVDLKERERLIGPLVSRACTDLDLSEGSAYCATCGASIPQMDSDLAAVSALEQRVREQLAELLPETSEISVTRIRLTELVPRRFETKQEVEDFLDIVRTRLLDAIEQGVVVEVE